MAKAKNIVKNINSKTLKSMQNDKTLVLLTGGVLGSATGYAVARVLMRNEIPFILGCQAIGIGLTWLLTNKK